MSAKSQSQLSETDALKMLLINASAYRPLSAFKTRKMVKMEVTISMVSNLALG